MTKELTCIGCPMGCQITAELNDGTVSDIRGNTCKVGERYAQEELTAPKRVVTALCPVKGSHIPLPVKTDRAIRKELIFECLACIAAHTAKPPVMTGDILIKNVLGTDVNIVATADRAGQ